MKIPWLESNYVFYKEKIDNNILFNSVIFQGYDDVGKFELALDIALYYVKRSSVEESIDKIFIIKKEDGAKNIKIDQVREVTKKLHLTSNRKVVIIKNAHDLNNNSSNALLKIIEEPTKNLIFLMTCNDVSKLLPTIKSRSQISKCSYQNFKNNEILKNYNKLNLFQYLSSDEKNFDQLLDNFDINYDIENNLKGLLSNNLSISDFCKYEKDINISNLINFILFELKQLSVSLNAPTNSNFSLLKPYFKNTPLKNIIQMYYKILTLKKNSDIIYDKEIILYAIGKIFKSYA